MNIGIICSTAGGAFSEVQRILAQDNENYKFCVITDRECGIESICESRGVFCTRIDEPDNKFLSIKAKKVFDEFGNIDFVLLFFTRLVTEDLFKYYLTFNIHPSLLPSFPGLDPIKKVIQSKVKFLGATLHLINEAMDEGIILAQICIPISLYNENILNSYSFIQKVYLSLLLIELFEENCFTAINNNSALVIKDNLPFTNYSNPCIRNNYYLYEIFNLQKSKSIEVIN